MPWAPDFLRRILLAPPLIGGRPSISVIVPTIRDEPEELLVNALKLQTWRPMEVLLVHDRMHHGPAWSRNRGIEQASGDIVALIDDDCLPPDDWLERLATTLERYKADIVGGTYEESDPLLADRRNRRAYPAADCIDHSGFVGAGGNIAFRRALLDDCQHRYGMVFDERLRFSQDWELIMRCRVLGATFAFSTVRVLHRKRVSRLGYLRHQFTRGQGIAALHRAIGSATSSDPPHSSLLWSGGASSAKKMLAVARHKIIGPLDIASFRSKRDFIAFWVGEKVQGIGFVWGLLFPMIGMPSADLSGRMLGNSQWPKT